ncbi:MAG: outer membrane beta-barrel protein, partial [Candidatus Zixiibacteriota bacterium]
TTMKNQIDLIDDDMQGWHMTSIGDGLHEALTQLETHGHTENRQVILLMTDGKGNSEVGVDDLWTPGSPEHTSWANSNSIIYTLGLGHNGGICSDTLAWLADSTGGDYRQTTDPTELKKFFIEALASAVNWGPATDPVEELAPGAEKTSPVIISDYDRSVAFTAYWANVDNALDLIIYRPNGDSIISMTPGIRFVKDKRYVFCQMNRTESNWVGEWGMKVKSKVGQTVQYSTTSLVESSLELKTGFDKLHHVTGDRVRVWAELVATPVIPLPPPTPEIVAYCDKPLEGVGNALHAFDYDPHKLMPVDSIADFDAITRKLDILRQQTGREILPRGDTTLVLYDDGTHDDGAAGDGLYANSFADTETQGFYTFQFIASNIPVGGGLTSTREWTKSFYNEVNIDPDYSVVDAKPLVATADGRRYHVRVVPKDRFGNYLGPGHNVAVVVVHPDSRREVKLTDGINGVYTKDVFLTQDEVAAKAELEVIIDGKSFALASIIRPLKYTVSIHGGAAVPTGKFANVFDPGFNILLDLDYHFLPNWSVVALLGYNDFKSKVSGIDDNYWINLSANIRYLRPLSPPWYLYIGGGPGFYIPENGDSEFGANIGFGVDYRFRPNIDFEWGIDYHAIFDPEIQFTHTHVGVIFRF